MLFQILAIAAASPCGPVVTRQNVVRCALSASDALRAQRLQVDATQARVVAANPVLPSNPVLELSGAYRSATQGNASALDWYVTVRQELEIAGQHGQRLAEAEAALGAARQNGEMSERDVAADAWLRYFEVLAAARQVALARELTESAAFVAKAARASAEQGVGSMLDGDVADAALVRVKRLWLDAQRRHFAAQATLSSLLQLDDPAPLIEGALQPLHQAAAAALTVAGTPSMTRTAVDQFAEVRRFELEHQQYAARASLYRRARVPNPSLSLFVQNDGFDERVFGLGVSFPIPLPQPLGRTHAGEIAEATALADRARVEVERARRQQTLQLAIAHDSYRSRLAERDAFSESSLQRAHEQLRAIATEVGAGRMPFREAALAQQALVELLASHLDAELQLCVASVQLVRAAHLPLDEEQR